MIRILFLLAVAITTVKAQEIIKPSHSSKTSFAIVTDPITYQEAKTEIQAYRQSVEKDGLGTYIIINKWSKPDEIRTILHQLYKNKKQPLEGAVFVGDIPVPMIREAQVLTSAFKMSEKLKWENSSVASDRFYDDFDLKFDYIKQDENTDRQNYHYYKLRHDSPHYVQMDIYSGRIKPAISGENDNSIEQIRAYLTKVVQVRSEKNGLDRMIVSTGHGYNSESTISWGNELLAFRSSFPKLFEQGNSIKFLNYRNADFLKFNLLTELNRNDLDFAFMTSHGTSTLQLLNGYPDVSSPQNSMINVGRYIRSKMVAAKEKGRDLEKVKADFQKSLGLNDKWFSDALTVERAVEDSVFNQNLDIHKEDLSNVNARVVYLNSCLTGSFHKKDYLAAYYPFSNGKNVVAFANSIGVLQDLWGTNLLGILQYGSRVGYLLQKTAFLETHILGDPTFHFDTADADQLNELLGSSNSKKHAWYSILKKPHADLQSYALTELFELESEKTLSPKLVEIFKNSPYESVRTQAYFLLRKYNNDAFKHVLALALNDNYEYLKRKALYDINDSGDAQYIDQIIERYINDQELGRSLYKINWLFQFFDYDKMLESLTKQLEGNSNIYNRSELLVNTTKKLVYEKEKAEKLKNSLANKQTPEKELLSEIRSLRLYRHHRLVPEVLDIANNSNLGGEVRLAAIESMSWFGQSYNTPMIIKSLTNLIQTTDNDDIKNQSLKSIQAIKDVTKRQF